MASEPQSAVLWSTLHSAFPTQQTCLSAAGVQLLLLHILDPTGSPIHKLLRTYRLACDSHLWGRCCYMLSGAVITFPMSRGQQQYGKETSGVEPPLPAG